MATKQNVKKVIGNIKGDQKWARVFGADLQPQHGNRAVANKNTFETNDLFKKACENAGIEVTKRQAAKWNNKNGKAYKVANRIEMTGVFLDV